MIRMRSLRQSTKRHSLWALWGGWFLARVTLVGLTLIDEMPAGDVFYYYSSVFGNDPSQMTEYPDAGVWPVRLIAALVGANPTNFLFAFIGFCLLIDAIFLTFILRFGGTLRLWGGWFWILFGTALGPVFVLRLDLFPGLFVAAFAALLFRHPKISAAMLALATATKLWPGVLAASLVGGWRSRRTWSRLVAFFGSLVLLVVITVITSGVSRLVSPLTYQGERGLQIESLAATIFMVRAVRDPQQYAIGYAESKSYEIHGPGTAEMVTMVDLFMLVILGFAVLWAAMMMLKNRWHPRTAIAFSLLLIVLLIVSNKVFSPQYLIWVGPILAVCLCISRAWQVRAMAGLLLVASVLTQGLYPFNYDALLDNLDATEFAVSLLVLRNVLVAVIAVCAAWWLIRETHATSRHRQSQ